MTMRTALAVTGMLALTACGNGYEAYYPAGGGPQIGALDPDFEPGNAGGQLVTITGGGFGDDADSLIVLMDNHNAEIVSVANNEIVIRTPRGPITGGPVEVLVANDNGYDLNTPSGDVAAYRYGQAVFDEGGEPLRQSPFYRGQRHFVQVSNLYESCYGGRGVAGCGGNSFNGDVGIDGSGEFFRFSYPRLHTTALGWLTAYDASPGQWTIGPPRSIFPSGVDDLRQNVDAFELVNPANEGASICFNTQVADEASVESATEACDGGEDQIEYDLGVLEFCEVQEEVEGGTGRYQSDWPINRDFFESLPGEGLDVELRMFDLQLVEEISLPPKADFDAEFGFDVPAGQPWTVAPPVDCADSNEDGAVTLDEDGIVLSWTPLPEAFAGDAETNSFVHVSFTFVDFAWYSLETVGMRASIVIPDDYEVGEDGLARLRIPNEVLYQIPDPNFNWSSETPQSGFLGRYDSNGSYLFMEAYRVTDYRLTGREQDGSGEVPVIFSYATGELTILVNFENPLSREDDCTDCIDGDGDGWTDDLDPDCNADVGGDEEDETNTTSEFTCNDGIDNNGDGLIDSEDPLCEAGWDGETTCADGIDNDGDGWVDDEDPACANGGINEDDSVIGGTCNDGLDNDADGWPDALDPGCRSADGDEDDGFSGTACNDGVDNDLHGDIDSEDLHCLLAGPDAASEQPGFRTSCRNDTDDDGDGFIDEFDPDCETGNATRETGPTFDPDDPETVLIPGCYDNIDNDGDGLRDAEDPGCWNPLLSFTPDGFLADEGANRGTSCTDNVDSDGDGWIDGLDPDCRPGSEATQEEVGFGTNECNDGIDNDGDGRTDSEDSRCPDGLGDNEG